MRNVGLARALSKLGYCSRSQAAELIRAGRVRLNGQTHREPEHPVKLSRDKIAVDGRRIAAREKIYLILNKPRGLVTTADDEHGRETVYECLDKSSPWLAPVGRLDKATEGLLLLTNDSEWAARILDPASHLDKIYHVRVNAPINDALLKTLSQGVTSEGDLLHVKRASVLRGGERRAWLEIVLEEGKNRHIRRMFEQLGIEVLRLVRVAIGPVQLGELTKGSTRPLTKTEKKALDQAVISATRTARTGSSAPR
ncbi:MAG TPA: pseudouridine synthase [Terriglobales bacterium]|nr:pseudouridine synthase [Terriglobales bacterium]